MSKLKIHDSCGVHSLHRAPGMLGAFASIGVDFTLSEEEFKEDFSPQLLLVEASLGKLLLWSLQYVQLLV